MKPGPRRCVLPGVVKRHRNDQEKAEEHAQELLEPPGVPSCYRQASHR